MDPTEHSPETPRVTTGFFGMLGGVFTSRGSGAPSVDGSGVSGPALSAPHPTLRLGWGRVRRACDPSTPSRIRLLVVMLMTCGLMGVSAASASAAGLETPRVSVEDVTKAVNSEFGVATPATEAFFRGVVNPNGGGEPGTYKFLYKASKTRTCTGESETLPDSILSGGRQEPVEEISGLTPGTEYAVCLLVENNEQTEVSISPVRTFTTPVTPEAPLTSTPAKQITATTAVLEGTLNPGVKANDGAYFEYTTEPTCNESPYHSTPRLPHHRTPRFPVEEVQAKQLTQKVAGLEPNREYKFCLIAFNEAGEMTPSVDLEESFTTLSAPPVVEGESASGVTATAATLEASIDPNNLATTYAFEYSTKATGETLEGAIVTVPSVPPAPLEGGPGQGASAATEPLTQATTYYYRVTAENTKGEKAKPGKIEHFTTYTPPEAPHTTEPAKSITATTAVLEGVLNPGAKAKEGWYFAYNEGPSCAGGPTTDFEAEVEGQALPVKTEVTSLQPNREYTFCLVAVNQGGESAQGNEVHLSTPVLPPTISGESASGVKATEATLHAKVNPNNQETSYTFEYATNEALTGATTLAGGPLTGFGEESVSVALSGLSAHQTYFYRVVAENTKGEKAVPGKVEHFTTGPLETPEKLEANPIGATTATLTGVLNPKHAVNPATYEFRYRQSATECEGGEPGEDKVTPATAAAGAEGEPAQAKLSELLPNTSYTYCLHETNSAGEEVTSAPTTFRTLPEAFATNTASTSITLHAVLNPEGSATSYHFEYGPNTSYGSETAEVSAGAGTGPIGVEVGVQNLTAASLYHYRVLATNAAHETFASEDQTFTTQPTNTTFTLPDNRAYEMVTPVQKQGALFKPTGAIRAAVSGDAIADIATLPTESGPGGDSSEQLSVLSTRTSAGWSSRTISAPHLATGPPIALEDNSEYTLFSEDLSSALAEPEASGFEQLSPQATEPTPYLHTLFFNGNVSEACQAPDTSAQSCYAPLVSASNDTASPFVPFGELRGNGSCVTNAARCGPRVEAGTPDLSDLVLTSQAPLTATPAPTGIARGAEHIQPDLYEYSAGRLQLLSILPKHKGEPEEGSAHLELAGREGINGGANEKGAVAARHAISDEGNRVVMDEIENGGARTRHIGLYLRDTTKDDGKGETIRLDEPEPECLKEGNCKASVQPEYVDANSEDTKIFFLDSAKLTADSGAYVEPGGLEGSQSRRRPDLYECEITEEAGHDKCKLTDLTPKTEAGESAKVAGVLGSSEDGSYVYFAAAGGLGIAPAGACKVQEGEYGEFPGEEPPAGELCNVFVRHDGVTRFVAALSQQDRSDWETGGLTGAAVRVAPNGEWLTFSSHRDLTGYDNRAASGGQPLPEMYLYAAQNGTLSCASCDPTGARPAGGASVPGWPATFKASVGTEAYYQPRYLSDEGRLFFNSPDALVPLDVSKQSEVYEYEPVGAGTCTESTSSGSELYVPQEHGCVALISTGTAAEGSRFLEAAEGSGEGEHGEPGSTGGRDVFFLTTEKALPQDVDTVPDVYDAHECTTASPCISVASSPSPCTTEASCKAPPTPQPTIYAAPSSATFVGPGNQATPPPPVVPKTVTKKTAKCKKGFVKNKKNKCVKKPKKKKTKAKRSSNDRRGK
jgi:hypothetical protein